MSWDWILLAQLGLDQFLRNFFEWGWMGVDHSPSIGCVLWSGLESAQPDPPTENMEVRGDTRKVREE